MPEAAKHPYQELTPVAESLPLWQASLTPGQSGIFALTGVSGTGKSSALASSQAGLRSKHISIAHEGLVYTVPGTRLVITMPAGARIPSMLEESGWNISYGLIPGNSTDKLRQGIIERYGPRHAQEIAEFASSHAFGSWDLVHQLAPQYPHSASPEEQTAFSLRLAKRFLHQQVVPAFWKDRSLRVEDFAVFSSLADPTIQLEFLRQVLQQHPAPTHDDLLEAAITGVDAEIDGRYSQLFRHLPEEPTIAITAHGVDADTYGGIVESIQHTVESLRRAQRQSGGPILGEVPVRRHDLLYWSAGTSLTAHPSGARNSRASFSATPEFIQLRKAESQGAGVFQFSQANHFVHREFAIRAAVVEGVLRTLDIPYSILWPVSQSTHPLLHPHTVFSWNPTEGLRRWSPHTEASIFKAPNS